MKRINIYYVLLGFVFLFGCEDDNSDLPVQIYPGVYQDACLTYADGDEHRLGDCGEIRDTVITLFPEDLMFVTIMANSGSECEECKEVTFYYDFDVENTCAKFEQQCSTIVYMHQPDNEALFVQQYFPDYRMVNGSETRRYGGGRIHWLMPLLKETQLPGSALHQYIYEGIPHCKGKSIESTNKAWTHIDDFNSFRIVFSKKGEKFEDNLPFFKQYFSHFELHMRYAVEGDFQYK